MRLYLTVPSLLFSLGGTGAFTFDGFPTTSRNSHRLKEHTFSTINTNRWNIEVPASSHCDYNFHSKLRMSADQQAAGSIDDSYDVVIVGSGIGGLSCAAMCALYGYSVAVFESHYAPGGCAHGYSVKSKDGNGFYHFDTGPSFFSGLNPNIPAKLSNPLRTVLDAIDEKVECIPYTTFGLKFPEGDFIHTPEFGKRGGVLEQVSGTGAIRDWDNMMAKLEPLAKAVDAMPTAALRGDIAVALTAGQFLPNFAKTNPLENLKVSGYLNQLLSIMYLLHPFTISSFSSCVQYFFACCCCH